MMDNIELWIHRQKNKPRILGVHLALFNPKTSTMSVAGYYIYHNGNLETCKRIHRDNLTILKLMHKPKLGRI